MTEIKASVPRVPGPPPRARTSPALHPQHTRHTLRLTLYGPLACSGKERALLDSLVCEQILQQRFPDRKRPPPVHPKQARPGWWY